MSASQVIKAGANALKASTKESSADKLQKTLQWLRKEPRPVLTNVRALSMVYAARNNHFGARLASISLSQVHYLIIYQPLAFIRHFAKEELPRISYANQNLVVNVDPKVVEKDSEPFSPTMTVTFG
jgi:small subunit ribosomal protein S25